LARLGSRLALVDVSAAGLAQVAEALQAGGVSAETRMVDVSAAADVHAAVDGLVASLGRLDLVVHCAAILGPGQFTTQSAAAFDRVVQVNLGGTVNVVRAVVPALRQSRGTVACVVSTAAVHGMPGLGAYAAAKHGVAGFCDAVRPELAREGVGLTTVFPLLIDTPLLAGKDIPPILRRGRRLPAEAVVRQTLAAVAAGRPRVFVPWTVRLLAAAHGIAPSVLDRYGRKYGF
jgi:NAD(P)-dependent dehydrogenase (short-subunit alcohol dehydrogenase family)